MATPLNDSSGLGFYGIGHWGSRVFWYNVPASWRRQDTSNYLQYLLKTWGDAGEDIIRYISELPNQRDPYLVRTKNSIVKWFYVTEVFTYEDEERGKVVRLVGEKNVSLLPDSDEDNPPSADETVLENQFPWFPYSPLQDVATFWQLNWRDTQYDVVNVRARNLDAVYDASNSIANEVWVKGGDLVLFFDYFTNRQWTLNVDDNAEQGTVVIGSTDGSQRPVVALPILPCRLVARELPASMATEDADIVIRIPLEGGGYRYLYDVPVDERTGTLNSESGGTITSTECGTVNYLSGNITVDLSALSEFSSTTASDIRIKYTVRGYFMKFNVPPTIQYVSKDYGFETDQYDPEDVQRSALANVAKFWDLKGSQDAYRIRGEISLFNVVMMGLYRLSSPAVASTLPVDHVYEIGTDLFTDVQPIYIRYDHIAGDELFYDAQYGQVDPAEWVPVTDHMLVAEDGDRWDGMTIGQAYAIDVTQGYYGLVSEYNSNARGPAIVSTVTQLTTDELSVLRWQNGYRYEITMERCQYNAFNYHKGYFALSVYDYATGPGTGTAPALSDTYYFIEEDGMIPWAVGSTPTADPKEDIGVWTVLVQFGTGVVSPISVNDNVAVRYLPKFDLMFCDYCRTSRMRGIIDVTNEAVEYYDTYEKIDLAIERLKKKLLFLTPKHVRVVEWEITRQFADTMYGVQNGAEVSHYLSGVQFVDNIEVLLTVQFRGDADSAGKEIDFEVFHDGVGTVWTETGWLSGVSNNDTWVDVTVDEAITIPPSSSPVIQSKLIATSSASSTYGDVRFIFKVTSREAV